MVFQSYLYSQLLYVNIKQFFNAYQRGPLEVLVFSKSMFDLSTTLCTFDMKGDADRIPWRYRHTKLSFYTLFGFDCIQYKSDYYLNNYILKIQTANRVLAVMDLRMK
jgi:hypothetical protein